MKDKCKGIFDVMGRQKYFIDAANYKFSEAVDKKKKSIDPWNKHDYPFLFSRLNEELIELAAELPICGDGDPDKIMSECLDVANFAFFIYEKAKQSKENDNVDLVLKALTIKSEEVNGLELLIDEYRRSAKARETYAENIAHELKQTNTQKGELLRKLAGKDEEIGCLEDCLGDINNILFNGRRFHTFKDESGNHITTPDKIKHVEVLTRLSALQKGENK